METLTEDLCAILEDAGLEEAHIVGLSYGGAIAQAFAARYPGAVASLTLAATTDHPFESFMERAAAVERDGMPAKVAPSLLRGFTPASLAENVASVRYARECVRRGDPGQIAAAWRAFAELDITEAIRSYTGPTLVLAGELDAPTTPTVMRQIAASMPGSHYQEMPARRTCPPRDQAPHRYDHDPAAVSYGGKP